KKDPKAESRDPEIAMKDAAAQEKIYRDAMKAKPNDITARVRLAEMIGQRYDRRDEAIDLLKNLPDPATEDRVGNRGLALKNLQLQGLSSLTNLRLDKLATVKSKTELEAMMPQIEEDYRKLEARAADNPFILRL